MWFAYGKIIESIIKISPIIPLKLLSVSTQIQLDSLSLITSKQGKKRIKTAIVFFSRLKAVHPIEVKKWHFLAKSLVWHHFYFDVFPNVGSVCRKSNYGTRRWFGDIKFEALTKEHPGATIAYITYSYLNIHCYIQELP